MAIGRLGVNGESNMEDQFGEQTSHREDLLLAVEEGDVGACQDQCCFRDR